MTSLGPTVLDLVRLNNKINRLYAHRLLRAQHALASRWHAAAVDGAVALATARPLDVWQSWSSYIVDSAQRAVLFWDTLRQRGNEFLAHERAGKPPLLDYKYQTVLDGRTLPNPVNYALVRIVPPDGVTVDDSQRPFIIIDPRAGHGPGIGGFKQDSQVGVALKAGHPVYFVMFYPRPEPGQTLPDVCEAEADFVREVVKRHPNSPKPVLVGNCQGGWATMLVAATHPDLAGPVVINGAPMSYWSGSWQGGAGENPMRYLGGLLGGAWLALWASDLGGGLVDGAHLVANFERLNPANTLWSKYYHLFANIDAEPARFLQFERWWGGYFLMNEAEFRWIVDNLFVGNLLARGEAQAAGHEYFDLKSVRSPIIVFSSAGDNITPPQQALNWISDVYSSTEEIKANGQVIVALLHADVGHLGIFVSGRVAQKEHAQIVEVLKHVESLRPGLYVMEIKDKTGTNGAAKYDVTIQERPLEDLRRLNRLERRDEKPFEVVAQVSALSETAYCLFVRPFVKPLVSDGVAEWGRLFHPLRVQHWALSDLNPFCAALPHLASLAKASRRVAAADNPCRGLEKTLSEVVAASLDLYRDLRDATMERMFFRTFGTAAVLRAGDKAPSRRAGEVADPRQLPMVQEALGAIGTGGYAEAVALMGALIGKGAGRIPLERLNLVEQFIRRDAVLSKLSTEEARRLRAEQAVIAELEPERGLQSLAELLENPADLKRARALLDKATAAVTLTPEQSAMVKRVRAALGEEWGPPSKSRSTRPTRRALR